MILRSQKDLPEEGQKRKKIKFAFLPVNVYLNNEDNSKWVLIWLELYYEVRKYTKKSNGDYYWRYLKTLYKQKDRSDSWV